MDSRIRFYNRYNGHNTTVTVRDNTVPSYRVLRPLLTGERIVSRNAAGLWLDKYSKKAKNAIGKFSASASPTRESNRRSLLRFRAAINQGTCSPTQMPACDAKQLVKDTRKKLVSKSRQPQGTYLGPYRTAKRANVSLTSSASNASRSLSALQTPDARTPHHTATTPDR